MLRGKQKLRASWRWLSAALRIASASSSGRLDGSFDVVGSSAEMKYALNLSPVDHAFDPSFPCRVKIHANAMGTEGGQKVFGTLEHQARSFIPSVRRQSGPVPLSRPSADAQAGFASSGSKCSKPARKKAF